MRTWWRRQLHAVLACAPGAIVHVLALAQMPRVARRDSKARRAQPTNPAQNSPLHHRPKLRRHSAADAQAPAPSRRASGQPASVSAGLGSPQSSHMQTSFLLGNSSPPSMGDDTRCMHSRAQQHYHTSLQPPWPGDWRLRNAGPSCRRLLRVCSNLQQKACMLETPWHDSAVRQQRPRGRNAIAHAWSMSELLCCMQTAVSAGNEGSWSASIATKSSSLSAQGILLACRMSHDAYGNRPATVYALHNAIPNTNKQRSPYLSLLFVATAPIPAQTQAKPGASTGRCGPFPHTSRRLPHLHPVDDAGIQNGI